MRHLLPFLLATASLAVSQTGIEQKAGLGGACRLCPWGAMAEVVQVAVKPCGYDVQICCNCNAADALRIVSEARLPPPYKPDRTRNPRSPEYAGAWSRRSRRGRNPIPSKRLRRGTQAACLSTFSGLSALDLKKLWADRGSAITSVSAFPTGCGEKRCEPLPVLVAQVRAPPTIAILVARTCNQVPCVIGTLH